MEAALRELAVPAVCPRAADQPPDRRASLARQQIEFEERFEIGSHLALMAMVARGLGWAITTPLGYMRAARFHDGLASTYPAPFGEFSRTISLFTRTDWPDRGSARDCRA